jgi:hypothetical protein
VFGWQLITSEDRLLVPSFFLKFSSGTRVNFTHTKLRVVESTTVVLRSGALPARFHVCMKVRDWPDSCGI